MGQGENAKKEANEGCRCNNCGSENLFDDFEKGETVCDDCGFVDSTNKLDSSGHVRSNEGSHNSKSSELGSIIIGKDIPNSIRRASKKEGKKRKTYLQDLFAEVDNVVPEGRVRQAVKDLLRNYDEKEAILWRLRGKLSGGEGREYRIRVLVAGAIAAVTFTFMPNEGNEIRVRWGIGHNDFVKAKKRFKRHILKLIGPIDKEGALDRRKKEILHHLDKYRAFLEQRVGWEIATHLYEEALRELAEHDEPVLDDDGGDGDISPIRNTKYGTKSSEVTAWEAILVAMLDQGMDRSLIQWLQSRVIPTSGGNVTKRSLRKYARRAAALADGGEEE